MRYSTDYQIPVPHLDFLTEYDIIEYAAEMELRNEEDKKRRLKAKNKAGLKKKPRHRRRRKG